MCLEDSNLHSSGWSSTTLRHCPFSAAAGRVVNGTYGKRVALHEAGHFLIAYLLGLLPRGYTLSSLDLFIRKRQLNVQAGCQFCDAAFQARG